jgi:membrane protease YdiL (CAAX protease family)
MFNRYWREYPRWMQLLQLGLMIFICIGFASGIAYVAIPKITGIAYNNIANVTEKSTTMQLYAAKLFQFITATFVFLVPAALFAYATHPLPRKYLGLRAPGKPVQWILVALTMLSILPVLVAIQGWMSNIDFGEGVKKTELQHEAITKVMLTMHSFGEFLFTLFVISVIPAVSEELMFRGIIMRFATRSSKRIGLGILISGILFALMHSTAYGFVSILIAGVLLGAIYYLTGSILCSMLAHLMNNGLQVVLFYLAKDSSSMKTIIENDTLPWWYAAVGALAFVFFFYLLWRNRTPLPKDWTDDFDERGNTAIG